MRDTVLGKVGVPEGDAHGKGGTLIHPAFDFDGSAMQLHQFLNESQTDAGALVSSTPGAFDAMKSLEDMRQFRFRYAASGIAHDEDCAIRVRFEHHGDAPGQCEFEG